MNSFFGRKTTAASNTQRALSKLMMTSALVAAGTLAMPSSAWADNSWSNLAQTGGSFDTVNPTANITNITVTSANGKAIGVGNADIYASDTVNVLNSNLFVVRDNRADPTQILGKLNSSGKVIVIDGNGIIFGKNSVINVGSLIATTGQLSDVQAMSDTNAPLLFTNFGAGSIENQGSIQASGLVAFVAPTVRNSGIINANLGRVSLSAGGSTATVDLYGDGLVEFAASPLVDSNTKYLSENTGSITGQKIQMTASAVNGLVGSVVNMEGVLNATSAVKTKRGEIILSANKVVVGKPTTKTATSVTGDDVIINAKSLDLGLTIKGKVTGSAKEVNISSNGAKIAQGLDVVTAGGKINVAAGTYNEHLVVAKDGVTINGAKAGVSGSDATRGTGETIINPNSPGIEITADNVTVDGLVFANAMGADGYGIFVNGGDNATLKNNIITDVAQSGIYLLNSIGSILSGNTINNTGKSGIYALNTTDTQFLNNNIGTIGTNNNINGDGILSENSDGAVFKGNTITETTSTASQIGSGIHILNSDNVTIGGALASDKNTISNAEWDAVKVTSGSNILVEGNDFDNLVRVGVYADGTNGIIARNNDIDNAKLYGVRFMGVTGASSVIGNTIDTTGIDGINIYFSNGVTVSGNTVGYGVDGLLNTADDTVTGQDALAILYSGNTTAFGNNLTKAARNGVYVTGNSSGNVLSGNTVNFTGKNGMYLLGTNGVQILNNNIGTVGVNNNINGDGVLSESSNGAVFKGNTITETTSTASQIGSGIHILNSSNVTIGGALASDKNTISNAEWDAVKVTGGSNILVEGNDFDNLVRVGVYADGTNGIIARNNDIDNAKLYGVRFMGVTGASSVIGNTIDTTGIDGINIYFSNGVTVSGNTVGYGVDGLLNTADDTVTGQDGLAIVYSGNTTATGNNITKAARNGIYVVGAAGNVLNGNTVNFTGKSGAYLLNTSGAQILNNKIGTVGVNNNINGDGVLSESSNGAVFKGNTITETTSTASKIGSGIHVLNSDNVTIGGPVASDKNTISNAEWDAVKVTAGNNVLVEGNDFDNLVRVGVYSEFTNNMVALNNDIDNANMYGVKYMGVTGKSSVVGNTIDTVGIDGINIYYSNGILVSDNTVGYGLDGIVNTSDDTVIKQDGLSILFSNGTQAVSNNIANAARNGVYVRGYSGTVLTDNAIDASGLDGIRVDQSNNINMTSNQIANSQGNGVNIINTSGLVQIDSNTITDSAANGILANNAGAIDLHIVGNTIQNTGFSSTAAGSAAISLNISGAGTAEIAGNTLGDNFDYGLDASSGAIDLTGATNTIQNTNTGMRFYPTVASTLSLVGNTIGTTAFVDQTGFFVDLGVDSMFAPGSPTLLDGENATYTLGGVTIDPALAGGVTQAEYDTLQARLNDYNDFADRGLFFFNVFPSPATAGTLIDQKDVLREFVVLIPDGNGGNLTITGLPSIGGTTPAPTGVFNPAAIEPAAGDEADASPAAADNVANIQPAAGSDTACWADANVSLGQGAPVTFNYGSTGTALLQDAANCGNTQAQGQI